MTVLHRLTAEEPGCNRSFPGAAGCQLQPRSLQGLRVGRLPPSSRKGPEKPSRPSGSTQPVPPWNPSGACAGRGMRTGVKNAGGVALADLRGDGKLAVLAATVGANGCARLVALDSAGKELWAHDFDRFPGEQSPLNVGGLFFWFPGRFNDPHRDDVLVSLARAQTHSEESFLLDGRTGTELWHRTVGSHFGPGPGMARAFGGGWMAIHDHDGDGLDDILTMYPDGILVVRREYGENPPRS